MKVYLTIDSLNTLSKIYEEKKSPPNDEKLVYNVVQHLKKKYDKENLTFEDNKRTPKKYL